jgi:osmotically inducible protein OsmC
MVRNASAVWKGGLKDGQGTLSTGSGAVKELSYNFAKRFEDQPGTNPEELVAAAQAACFAMAASGKLDAAGLKAESLDVKATLTFEKLDVGMTTTRIHLELAGKVPGATPDVFLKAAEEAKRTCPISRLLNTTITLEAKLV